MKFFVLTALFFSSFSSALHVTKASYDPSTNRMNIEVQYSGGCFEHIFEMHLTGCIFKKPLGGSNYCNGELADVTGMPDLCQAWLKKQLSYSLDHIENTLRPIKITFESGAAVITEKT